MRSKSSLILLLLLIPNFVEQIFGQHHNRSISRADIFQDQLINGLLRYFKNSLFS